MTLKPTETKALSKHPLLQNYISGRTEAVHIKYVSDLGLRLKLGTF